MKKAIDFKGKEVTVPDSTPTRYKKGKRYIIPDSEYEGIKHEWADNVNKAKKSAYVANRINEYGSIEEQIEFITENGLKAWQDKVSDIKSKYPKGE